MIMNKMMKMFSFTKSEIRIILFIISVLVTGFLIKYYKQVISNESLVPYDYTESDSEFRERSRNINNRNIINGQDTSDISDEQLLNSIKTSEDSLRLNLKTRAEKESEEYSGPKLNINTATLDEFIDLPGIGESTAEKIIQYRESKKGFKRIEDIMNVKGIGDRKFKKLKSYIKTE